MGTNRVRFIASTMRLAGNGQAGDPDVVLTEITIECPVCGRERIVIPEHHLRGVLSILQEVLEDHADVFAGLGSVENISTTREVFPLGPDLPSC